MNNEVNAILFSKVDKEDYWVCGGIVFKVENTNTYADAYNEIKHKIESPEVIEYIIKSRDLLNNLFEDDESYKFMQTRFQCGLYFVFQNSEGNIIEYRMSADFVKIL
jgi:hypothetical protein